MREQDLSTGVISNTFTTTTAYYLTSAFQLENCSFLNS